MKSIRSIRIKNQGIEISETNHLLDFFVMKVFFGGNLG